MKYKSESCEAIHEHAVEMYKIGAITETSMREYDRDCLVQEPNKTRKTAVSESRLQSSSAGIGRVSRISAKSAGM